MLVLAYSWFSLSGIANISCGPIASFNEYNIMIANMAYNFKEQHLEELDERLQAISQRA